MENKSSNVLEKIIEKAKRENRAVNIYAHKFPDGDAIASSKALEQILQDRGIKARYIVTAPRVNNRYSKVVGETNRFQGRVNRNDISVILDTSTVAIAENKLFTYSRPENTFVIDHHSKDGVAIEDELKLPKGNILRNSSASSTCEMITEMLKDSESLTPEYATKLLVGLWTDTAKFRYIGKDSLKSLTTLLEAGADFEAVKGCLEAKKYLSQEVGLAKALLHTKKIKIGNTYFNYLGVDNKTATELERKYRVRDIQKKIFRLVDTENTSMAVAIAEKEPNNYFCEFRSAKDLGNVDVFSVATSFGGGGHYNASGCTVTTDQGLDKASRDVLTRLTDKALPNLVGLKQVQDSPEDIELKKILDSMDRFNTNLTSENFDKIEELISQGARYQSDYDEKISFEEFMVRNSILAQIPDNQLQSRRISFKLNKKFIENMQNQYGVSEEDILNEIELFKEIDVDYVSMMTYSGKCASIDSQGNIKQSQKTVTEK